MWFPLAAIAGGIVIEILQGMTASRSAEVFDVVAEAIGIAAALAVHSFVRWLVTTRTR